MDLKKFKFPNVTDADLAFSTFNTIPELLKEAESRGFGDWNNPYHKLFSTLLFNGGKVNFREDLEPEFKDRAWRYCRALMSSFEPKHEDKAAVCSMLMSELLES